MRKFIFPPLLILTKIEQIFVITKTLISIHTLCYWILDNKITYVNLYGTASTITNNDHSSELNNSWFNVWWKSAEKVKSIRKQIQIADVTCFQYILWWLFIKNPFQTVIYLIFILLISGVLFVLHLSVFKMDKLRPRNSAKNVSAEGLPKKKQKQI